MTRTLPVLDMAGWSILDFELAYDGLVAMARAGNGLLCQPRSVVNHNHRPGALLIESLIEDRIDWQVTDLIDRLKVVRFSEAEDDDRRIRMLLHFELDHPGMAVPGLVALALEQSVRQAA